MFDIRKTSNCCFVFVSVSHFYCLCLFYKHIDIVPKLYVQVERIKERVEEKEGIPPAQQR